MKSNVIKSFKLFAGAALLVGALSAQATLIWQDVGDVTQTNSAFAWGGHSSAGPISLVPLPTQMTVLPTAVTTALSVSSSSIQSAIGLHYFPSTVGNEADAEQRFTFTNLGAAPTVSHKELWIRYKLWVPTNYYHRANGGHNNNKFVYLWSGDYNSSDGKNGYGTSPNITAFETTPTANGSSQLQSYACYPGSPGSTGGHRFDPKDFSNTNYTGAPALAIDVTTDLGKWIDFIVHVKASTANNSGAYPSNYVGNGVLELWKNGTKIWSQQNVGNYYYGTTHPQYSGFQTGYLLGYANSGFNQHTYMYIDGMTVGTTSADVGLGTTISSPPAPPASLIVK